MSHPLATPEAVRRRADEMLALAERDGLPHFRLVPERLADAVDLVVAETRANYPDLDVPLHSRWRHFSVQGRDLWAELRGAWSHLGDAELARARIELAIVSVLLDAGAGPAWRYRDRATGGELARSEGLAVASFRMFEAELFSAPGALQGLTAETLAAGFQAGPGNPLVGLEGRAALLRALGKRIAALPAFETAAGPRLGRLHDVLVGRRNRAGTLPAREILVAILEVMNPVWPSGLWRDGVALGDVGRHGALSGDGLVPFHKLSQWLAYSLIEPLREAGVDVVELDGLTGLPEYRNGGLFLDTGVLVARDSRLVERRHRPGDEAIVEWRALTVALLDRLAIAVRARLGEAGAGLSLGAILQGGSWSAGRRLADQLRDGRPPLDIESDGTVF